MTLLYAQLFINGEQEEDISVLEGVAQGVGRCRFIIVKDGTSWEFCGSIISIIMLNSCHDLLLSTSLRQESRYFHWSCNATIGHPAEIERPIATIING